MIKCRKRLNELIGNNVHTKYLELRKTKHSKWKLLPQRGIGVAWYEYCTITNNWVSNKIGLISSEWINSIKMYMNTMAYRIIVEEV